MVEHFVNGCTDTIAKKANVQTFLIGHFFDGKGKNAAEKGRLW